MPPAQTSSYRAPVTANTRSACRDGRPAWAAAFHSLPHPAEPARNSRDQVFTIQPTVAIFDRHTDKEPERSVEVTIELRPAKTRFFYQRGDKFWQAPSASRGRRSSSVSAHRRHQRHGHVQAPIGRATRRRRGSRHRCGPRSQRSGTMPPPAPARGRRRRQWPASAAAIWRPAAAAGASVVEILGRRARGDLGEIIGRDAARAAGTLPR